MKNVCANQKGLHLPENLCANLKRFTHHVECPHIIGKHHPVWPGKVPQWLASPLFLLVDVLLWRCCSLLRQSISLKPGPRIKNRKTKRCSHWLSDISFFISCLEEALWVCTSQEVEYTLEGGGVLLSGQVRGGTCKQHVLARRGPSSLFPSPLFDVRPSLPFLSMFPNPAHHLYLCTCTSQTW